MVIRRNWQKIILGVVIIVGLGFLSWGIYRLIHPYLPNLTDQAQVREWAQDAGWKGWIIFSLLMALQIIIAVIPGGPLEIGAGYAYGPLGGMIIILIGALIGSTLVFLLVKRFGHSFIHIFISDQKLAKLHLLQDPQRLNRITFIVFLIPGTPKDLLTYAVGLTPMSLKNWLMITLFARAPAVFVSTYGGNALLHKEYGRVAVIFTIVTLLSIVGYWFYTKINEKYRYKKIRQHQRAFQQKRKHRKISGSKNR